MKNKMIWLYMKQDDAPTRCNVYNSRGSLEPEKEDWFKACCFQTNVLFYIWSIMPESPCKNKIKMYCSAFSRLSYLSKIQENYL